MPHLPEALPTAPCHFHAVAEYYHLEHFLFLEESPEPREMVEEAATQGPENLMSSRFEAPTCCKSQLTFLFSRCQFQC